MTSITGNLTAPKPDDYGGDEISALILDPGSSTTRAGFAGEDTPKSVINTNYGRTKKVRYIFGDESLHTPSPGFEIHNPMAEDGTVEDWDAATRLWEYTIRSRLTTPKERDPLNEDENGVRMEIDGANGAEAEPFLEDNPLLLTEPAWNSAKNREKAIEIAMEEWGCAAYWTAKSGVLAAFAHGKPSALVIDVGARSTSITPVHDGLVLRKGVLRTPLAGDFLSQQIRQQFASSNPPIQLNPHYMVISKNVVEAGNPAYPTLRSFTSDQAPHPSFRRLQEERILQEFKEAVVEVWSRGGKLSGSNGGVSNEDAARQEQPRAFEFPDGYNQLFGVEQFRAAEGMFDPRAAFTSDSEPAPNPNMALIQAVQTSISQVDVDIRPHLLANIVVTGAGSLVRGFSERLNGELMQQFPAPRVKIAAAGNLYERRFASWIGGSILASLGTFHQMWISKKEFEEHGPSIVEKRCK